MKDATPEEQKTLILRYNKYNEWRNKQNQK
jgi:hypothetical protein